MARKRSRTDFADDRFKARSRADSNMSLTGSGFGRQQSEPSWAEREWKFAKLESAHTRSVRGGRKGGRKNPVRDLAMAREYERRRPTSRLSDSALMEAIGAEHGLVRSSSIAAVKRGLQAIHRLLTSR